MSEEIIRIEKDEDFVLLIDKINQLQKENEELKEAIKEYEDMITHYNTSQKIYSKIKELLKEYKDTGYYEVEKVLKELLEG